MQAGIFSFKVERPVSAMRYNDSPAPRSSRSLQWTPNLDGDGEIAFASAVEPYWKALPVEASWQAPQRLSVRSIWLRTPHCPPIPCREGGCNP